jgi:hypothetical protein
VFDRDRKERNREVLAMKRAWVVLSLLIGLIPISGVDAVPIDAAVKKCLEKSVGKSATRSIERAKKLTAKQQRSVDACKKTATPTTTQPPLLAPEFVAQFDVDPALGESDVSTLRERTILAITAHQQFLGVRMTPFVTNASRDIDWLSTRDCRRYPWWKDCRQARASSFEKTWAIAGCSPAPVQVECYQVVNIANFSGDELQQLKVVFHEVHHVVQYQLHRNYAGGSFDSSVVPGNGPDWITEGLPEWTASWLLSQVGRRTMTEARDSWVPYASAITKALSGFEAVDGRRSIDGAYRLYALAIDELMKLNGNTPKSITSYYQFLGEKSPWPTAFQRAFGMTVQDFYAHFERVRPRS